MTPYYDDGARIIYHGLAEEVVPKLSEMPLVITSPPYNLGGAPWPHLGHWKPGDSPGGKSKWRNGSDGSGGVQYHAHKDTVPWPAYVAEQHTILSMLWEKLPPTGAIFYNHKPRTIGARCWTPLELIPPHVILRQIIIWARPGGMNFNPTAFVPTHEWILLLAKPAFRLRSKGASGIGDVWRMTPDANPHPAPFPVSLPMKALEATGAAVVCDPYMGSGTTLHAAKLLGRKAIGIEKSEADCEYAATRLENTLALTYATVNTVPPGGQLLSLFGNEEAPCSP